MIHYPVRRWMVAGEIGSSATSRFVVHGPELQISAFGTFRTTDALDVGLLSGVFRKFAPYTLTSEFDPKLTSILSLDRSC